MGSVCMPLDLITSEQSNFSSNVSSKKSKEKVIDLFLARRGAKSADRKEEKNRELVLQFRLKARKLARSILRKWHARLDLEEVDSIVDLSLCEAVRRYNPRKGASFMTFLYYHLRGNLIRSVSYAAAANAIPVEEPAVEPQVVEEPQSRKSHRGVNAIEVAEALCSTDHFLPDEVLLKKELVSMSIAACTRLDMLEREVIERIYLEGQQLMDIARTLGYSRCHISRVKRKALETLYDDLTSRMDKEDVPEKPDYSCDVPNARRLAERKRIHRRRPRSKSALEKVA